MRWGRRKKTYNTLRINNNIKATKQELSYTPELKSFEPTTK